MLATIGNWKSRIEARTRQYLLREINCILLSVILLSLTSNVFGANFITDEATFVVLQPGLSTIDFEGIAPIDGFKFGLPSDFVSGLLFEASLKGVNSKSFENYNFPQAPSDYFIVDSLQEDLKITFMTPVTAIGLRVAFCNIGPDDSGGFVGIELFNETTEIWTKQLQASGVESFNTFIGVDEVGQVSSIYIRKYTGNGVIALDDLRFVSVPEPNPGLIAMILSLAICWRNFVRTHSPH